LCCSFIFVDLHGFARICTELSGNYWVTVALGPITEAVDRNGTFLATLRRWSVDADARCLESAAPPPAFQILLVKDLLPKAAAAQLAQLHSCTEPWSINKKTKKNTLHHKNRSQRVGFLYNRIDSGQPVANGP